MRSTRKIALLAVAVLAALTVRVAPADPVKGLVEVTGTVIPNQYIVVFHDTLVSDVGVAASTMARENDARIQFVYQHALKGFSAEMSPAAAAKMALDRRVAWIEPDQEMELIATQSNPPWGLDRIDQRDRPLNQSYVYNATGSGVKSYIIDTGIRRTHADFGGRAIVGYDAITSGGSANDCNGHGTHVAGSAGGTTYGVAKSTTLVAVRVLDCNGSGSNSGVIAGVDWVTADHLAGQPAVANMSLGGGASSALDTAVNNSINDGVTYVVAAGNGDFFGNPQNACNYSPARVAAAITVGATDSNDARASFSNFGTCLDIFAPGVSILSAWHSSDTATNTISGTSMASPHVAGAAAMYLQGNTSASPATVSNALTSNASSGKVSNPGTGSPNLLLYTAFIGGGGGNQAPTANFTYSCSGLTCNFTDTSTDSDGTISSRSWNFGDGTTSTATNPSKTYSAAGTYTVTLTVTDNGGATGSTSKSVTVSSTSSPCGADPNTSIPNLTNGVFTSGTAASTTVRW
ncbi:MAG TPA: S8 family serine peptidase, partial [Actinomycetota bacterium]|nr:S8 family serine peptidase [Actinomycetota bacterium]